MSRRNLLITGGITLVLIYICFGYLFVSSPMPSDRTPTPAATSTTQPATNTPSPTPISSSPTATFTSPLTAAVTLRSPLTATATPPSPTPLPTITPTPVPPSPTPLPTITPTPVPPSATPLPTTTPAPVAGTTFRDITEILKNIATIGAIIAGGIWTYMLFVKKRERYPRAKLTHSITHRSLTEDKVLLHVIVTISNTGELLLEFDEGTIFVQQVLPLSPKIRDVIEKDRDPVSDGETEIGWPSPKGVKPRRLQRELGEFQIEPGDSQDVYCDFVLNADVQTVLVYSFFSNIIKERKIGWHLIYSYFSNKIKERKIGWNLKTIYDLQSREQESDQ